MSAFEFKKFPSLENHYQVKPVQHVHELGFADELYVVTEKVHGANFSFHTNGVELQCAKRTSFIEKTEKFYNYRPVADKYREGVLALSNFLNAPVIIYGELFGGNIQAGMPYKNEQDFAAFDLVVNGKPVNKLQAFELLREFGIPTVPVIGYYPDFASAMALTETFTSFLLAPDFSGDVAHAEAEGLVIEPIDPKWYPSGSRVYFKKKTKRFLENGGNKLPKPKQDLPECVMETLITAQGYINQNRFNSLVSKEGELTIKDIGRATGLFVQDVLEDMHRELPDCYEHLTDGLFTKALSKEVTNFLRPILLQK